MADGLNWCRYYVMLSYVSNDNFMSAADFDKQFTAPVEAGKQACAHVSVRNRRSSAGIPSSHRITLHFLASGLM